MRQIVGDRQRLGSLEQQRVVERARRRFEQHADRSPEWRGEPRRPGRTVRDPARPAPDAPAPATQRERHHRGGRTVVHPLVAPEVGGDELLAAFPGPTAEMPYRAGPMSGIRPGRRAPQLARQIRRDDRPARRRKPTTPPVQDELRKSAADRAWCSPHGRCRARHSDVRPGS